MESCNNYVITDINLTWLIGWTNHVYCPRNPNGKTNFEWLLNFCFWQLQGYNAGHSTIYIDKFFFCVLSSLPKDPLCIKLQEDIGSVGGNEKAKHHCPFISHSSAFFSPISFFCFLFLVSLVNYQIVFHSLVQIHFGSHLPIESIFGLQKLKEDNLDQCSFCLEHGSDYGSWHNSDFVL